MRNLDEELDMLWNDFRKEQTPENTTLFDMKTENGKSPAELLGTLQNAIRDLQTWGMWIGIVNLPVRPGEPPRVALHLDGVWWANGNLSVMAIEATSSRG